MAVDVGRTGIWCVSRAWPDDPGKAEAAASELEGLGYGALWLGISRPSLQLPEMLLAATSSLAVATGIVSIWDAPAAELAAAYHRVADLFADRFLLGIGASHAHAAERAGQQYRRPYSKVAAYLDGLDAASAPVPRDRRVVAALGPKMTTLAGQRSAGAHPYLTTPEHTQQARELLGPGPLLAPEQMVVLSADPARARQIARDALGFYLQAPNYIASLLRLGFTEEDISQASARVIDALVAWGGEDAIRARVQAHHQAGADHVCVQVLTGEPGLPLAQWRALAQLLA
ncbi:MAG TPA: LLM class F420-dependent oxidoreductase [Streptosporangiaceae bacterium]